MLKRRGFLAALGLLAAPAIIRTPGLLMLVKPIAPIGYRIEDYLTSSNAWFSGGGLNEQSLQLVIDQLRNASPHIALRPTHFIVRADRFDDFVRCGLVA